MESTWQRNGEDIEFADPAFQEPAVAIANAYKARFDALLLEHQDEAYTEALLKKQGYTYSIEVGFELCLTRIIQTPTHTLTIEEGRRPGDMRRDTRRGVARIREKGPKAQAV